jgi:hypothetical protein
MGRSLGPHLASSVIEIKTATMHGQNLDLEFESCKLLGTIEHQVAAHDLEFVFAIS